MRLVPVLAAVCAAAAVSVLVVPGASAAPSARHVVVHVSKPSRAELPKLHAKARSAAAATCDPSDNAGPTLLEADADPATIAIGVHDRHAFIYSALLSHDCPISEVHVHAVRTSGASTIDFPLFYAETEPDGSEWWAVQVTIDPEDLQNVDAGTWHATVRSTDVYNHPGTATGAPYDLQRWGRMTNNASPEPVRKGATITIAGKLSRANWDDLKYHGYANHPVTLQFRTLTGGYSNVRTITTSSTGTLKTTVKAARDGCFRFRFAGTTTTQAVKGTGDCVDVR